MLFFIEEKPLCPYCLQSWILLLNLKHSLLCGCFRVLPYTPDSSINAMLVNPSVFSCWKEPRIHQSCSLRVSSRTATTIKMPGAGPRFSAGVISLPMQAVELQQFVAHNEICLTVSLVFGMSVLVVLCCEIPVVLVWFMVWSMSFAKSTVMWGSGGSCNSGDKTGKRMLFFFYLPEKLFSMFLFHLLSI